MLTSLSRHPNSACLFILTTVLSVGAMPIFAQTDDPLLESDEKEDTARLYRSNAERRETGLQHAITPWLTLSGLAELEGTHERFSLDAENDTEHRNEASASLQLGMEVMPWEMIKGELLLEYDTDVRQLEADEAFVSVDVGDWELELGRLYTPFGVYFSQFASGPILEFGETRSNKGVKINHDPGNQSDVSLMVYRGRAERIGRDDDQWDWALAGEGWLSHSLFLGLSYQSDLADSDERLLADEDNRYSRKVPGVSGFILWTTPQFDISFEGLGATSPFKELERNQNKPIAWNLEFAHFLSAHFQWALRLEGSREIEDEPELQIGTALTWRTGQSRSITLEYLHGEYQRGLAENDEGDQYKHVDHVGVLLSVAF